VRLDLRYIPTEELSIYYQACDVAVYPYREITQSGSLMTGIAFGKMIVTTDLPGFREALEDYDNAVCVSYGDVKLLSQTLAGLIDKPQVNATAARKGYGRDSCASWDIIARKTRQCYESVLSTDDYTEEIACCEGVKRMRRLVSRDTDLAVPLECVKDQD
jgi:glycosyltransferase involved in cell wall biosynthesis